MIACVGMAPMWLRRSRSIAANTATGSKASWMSDAAREPSWTAMRAMLPTCANDSPAARWSGAARRPAWGRAGGLDLRERQAVPVRVPGALRRPGRAAGEHVRHGGVRRRLGVRRLPRFAGDPLHTGRRTGGDLLRLEPDALDVRVERLD